MSGDGASTAAPVIDEGLLRKYDVAGPRFTSYPTAPQFRDDYGPDQHGEAMNETAAAESPAPLSVYVHLPFCQELCHFCGCNMMVSHDRSRPDRYLDAVEHEMETAARHCGAASRDVVQLHYGGGTPTFLTSQQLRRLKAALDEHFSFSDSAELGLEVDPRDCSNEQLEVLGDLGFNRLSMGVQDFQPKVQQAINRVQSEEDTRRVVEVGRRHGMRSVNIDLIYGLPHQTAEGFADTVEKVLDIGPDRLAVFNFAFLPDMIKHQRVIDAAWLPSPDEKLAILRATIGRLCEAGFVFIGMDHFARADDELAVAQREGVLHRNFQGYTTHPDCDLVGLGVSAISQVGATYAQNRKVVREYEDTVGGGGLATMRGYRLSRDDEIRRQIIMGLISNLVLDVTALERRWGIVFADEFATELEALEPLCSDGLVEIEPGSVRVTALGRLLVRNICMPFDAYLGRKPGRFSRTV